MADELPPRPAAAPSDDKKPAPRRAPPSLLWLVPAVLVVVALVAIGRARRDDGEPGRPIVPVGRDDDERERTHDAEPEREPETRAEGRAERLRVNVLRSFPHDTDAFTQGLLWHEGDLYESTGQYGRSTLRRVDLESGTVEERRALPREIFAEGLARVGDRLFQISWQEGEARVWSLPAMEPVRTFEYEGEGWGLCYDGTHLVMSDGSDRLFFRDPETFEVQRSVDVRLDGEPLDQLNELECVDGVVWSNVWQTDRIVRIDPASGRVTAVVDARGLLERAERRHADVLNGIAWIPERGHFVITGKLWPRMFEVEFVPR